MAGGLIATALLDVLLSKEILTLTEIRGILQRAVDACGPNMKTPEGSAAFDLIASLQRGKFSARG
jgi:hypothetical protein